MSELRAIILPGHLHDWNALGQDDAEAFGPIAINGLLADGGREVVLREAPKWQQSKFGGVPKLYVIVEGDDER